MTLPEKTTLDSASERAAKPSFVTHVPMRAPVTNTLAGSSGNTSPPSNAKARLVKFTGKVTQAGAAVAAARVVLLVNGKSAGFSARANASGNYSVVLKKTGKKTTSTFQARTTVAERDITATGCASPTPGVPGGCVSATASPFTAVSAKIRIRL